MKTDALVTKLVKRVTAQIKMRAKEKEGKTEATIPNGSHGKNTEEPPRGAGVRKQDGGSNEKPSGNLAAEAKGGDYERTQACTPQGVKSATGDTEKSDQMQAATSREENTTKEKPDVNAWMKNYKQKRKSATKTNPLEHKTGHQEKSDKAQPKETLSTDQRETVVQKERDDHQQNREARVEERSREPYAEKTHYGKSNKVENEQENRNEMEEKVKVKQMREERRDGEPQQAEGEQLKKRDIDNSKSNNVDVKAEDRGEHGRMDRDESSADAPTTDGQSGEEFLWPGIRGTVEATESKSEKDCIWPYGLDRYQYCCYLQTLF